MALFPFDRNATFHAYNDSLLLPFARIALEIEDGPFLPLNIRRPLNRRTSPLTSVPVGAEK
jgi:hypothetical protein